MAYPVALRLANERRHRDAQQRQEELTRRFLESGRRVSPTRFAEEAGASRKVLLRGLQSEQFSTTVLQFRYGSFGDPVLDGVKVEGFWRYGPSWNKINGAIGAFAQGKLPRAGLESVLREFRGKTYSLPKGIEGFANGPSHISGRTYRYIDDRDVPAILEALRRGQGHEWGRGIETPQN